MHRSTRHSIARTTLALNRASLTIGSLRSITVADLHVPFFFTFIAQDFSLRAPITVALPIIDKRRAMIRRTNTAPFIGAFSLAGLIHTGCDEFDFSSLHRHDIVPADKPAVGHHLAAFRIRVDLHVIAGRKSAVRLLHHSRLGITRAHPSFLFVLTFLNQLLKFLNRPLQSLLALTPRPLARLGHAPARFLFAHRSHRLNLLRRLLKRLLHSFFPTKTIPSRLRSDLGPVLHHSL